MSFSRLLSLVSVVLATVAAVSGQTTWYWSYSEIPYYTWNSEWYECASGTLTSSSSTANFDGSFLATGITGTRTFYNTSGMFPTQITGLSTYAIADNRFWPSGSSNAAVDADGLSYTVSGSIWSVYGDQTSAGAVNIYLQGASGSTGQIVEGDQPGGDVLTYMTISSSQSAIQTCPTTQPTVQTWSWMYTLTNSDSSYVCASGHLTTWVGYTNGSYQVEDVQGARYIYTPSNGLNVVGIVGVAQPFANGGNTNLVYSTASGASILDAGGLAVDLNTNAAFGSSLTAGSGTVLLIRGGSSLSELGGASASSSSFTIVPWSATAPQCNSSSALQSLPSSYASGVTTYNFIYTIQPYYTWDDEWSVCTSGTMTVYTGARNSDGSYNVLAMTGVRRYSKNGATTYQSIVELITPGNFEGNDNRIWVNQPSLNGGYTVDTAGLSYNVNGTALFTNGGAVGAAVNVYQTGTGTYYEFDNNAAPLDTTGQFIIGTGSSVPACPVASTTLQNYNFMYTIQQSSSFAVCVSGQLQASTPNLDGGLQILNIANANRNVYTAQGYASQGIGGVASVNFNGYANNNELYATASSPFSGDGFIYNMYEPVQVNGNFSSAYSVGITYINGQFYEYEPTGTQPASSGMQGTFQMSTTTTYTCATTPSTYGVTTTTPATGSITAYFSYTIAPYYTWNGEWSICASGTITANAAQNADYSYTATNVQGIRRYANNSGTYTQQITGASTYDGGDSYFWLTANQFNHPPVDLGGFSYSISGYGGLVLVPNTASGNSGQSAVNFFMIQSPWPSTPNWFQTPSLSLSEADAPTGDVISSAVFSLNQADVLNCASYAVPTTKVWQFYYTQQANSNEYFVCGSGQFTTWVANTNGGYLVIDAEGFRNFYVTNDTVFGYHYVFSTGIDGMYGPLEWSTNDNYIYPGNSGSASVLDTNGILMVASPVAFFAPNIESNFVELRSNGNLIYEYLSASATPGTGLSGSMQIWPLGSSSAMSCNTTNPPSPFPAHLYYAFIYTITPYYTWNGYWSVCASGIMTVTGWSAQDYTGAVPAGAANAVIGITGTRQYTLNGAVQQSSAIAGLVQPDDNEGNTNMLYTASGSLGPLDSGGITYQLAAIPQYANGYNGDSNLVNVYNAFSGASQQQILEVGSVDQAGYDTQGQMTFASVSSASAQQPSAQSCSSLATPQQRSYAFMYTINSTTSNSNWQVCATGQVWTNYVGSDGGQLVMEIRGSRYFNYPSGTYMPSTSTAFVQSFSGVAAPGTLNNDNMVYPNRASQYLSANGVLANTNSQVTQQITGPSPYSQVSFVSYVGSNAMFEQGGPSSNIASNFQLTPYSATGQNPTCKAPYSTAATQTLYFSYQLAFSGGSVCASGAITALSTANSDGSYTAIWMTGFRSFVYNGVYTNATITGLAPQAQNFAGGLTGDQKVFTSGNMVSANGLFYQTDNLIYYAPGGSNAFQGSGWVNLQYANGALTESGASGSGATSSGVTSASGVVSTSASAVTQCGTTSVTVGAGSEALSPTTGGGNTGATVNPRVSSSSSTGGSANGGGGASNAGGGGGGGISKGGIAGAVIGSVVGAIILFVIIALLVSRGAFGGKGKGSSTGEEGVAAGSGLGSSRFTPMEESRGAGQSDMELSQVERNTDGETA